MDSGTRLSLRRIRPDGEQGDLLGWVLASDDVRVRLRDRWGAVHEVAWADVLALRTVGVARGRDPRRARRSELDRLAAAAGISGRVFVARVGDVLDGREPPPLPDPLPPAPCGAVREGGWVSAGDCADYVALAWWAAHADARSLHVRTGDPGTVEVLQRLGFTEVRDEP